MAEGRAAASGKNKVLGKKVKAGNKNKRKDAWTGDDVWARLVVGRVRRE
jgi:hypothetical protein